CLPRDKLPPFRPRQSGSGSRSGQVLCRRQSSCAYLRSVIDTTSRFVMLGEVSPEAPAPSLWTNPVMPLRPHDRPRDNHTVEAEQLYYSRDVFFNLSLCCVSRGRWLRSSLVSRARYTLPCHLRQSSRLCGNARCLNQRQGLRSLSVCSLRWVEFFHDLLKPRVAAQRAEARIDFDEEEPVIATLRPFRQFLDDRFFIAVALCGQARERGDSAALPSRLTQKSIQAPCSKAVPQ